MLDGDESRILAACQDAAKATRNLEALKQHWGANYPQLCRWLARALPLSPDADFALNHLERFFAVPAYQAQALHWLAEPTRPLEVLLALLGVSQFFADTLLAYPESLGLVRNPLLLSPSTATLVKQLRAEVDSAYDDAGQLRAFRKFRQLQMLRIGMNDVIRDRPLEEITRDLARLADASIEVALQTAQRTLSRKFGSPSARLAAFAFGKLGGDELNYSSDIDLMFVYDRDGQTTGRPGAALSHAEFFARVVSEVVRLLSTVTDRGFAYRVDLRLRPDGARGPLVRALGSTLSYYDARGRTWERQALIKVRHCAGDAALGREFQQAIEPFVYRKYFSFSEINEVKALKRRMEQRSTQAGVDELDVKTGRGGIRDIEYTVQFLQLLNGGDLPAVRQRNTLLALEALEIAGCLTGHETYVLSDAYRFLRRTEHRLQLLFDWQTHKLPTQTSELAKLARRMGYQPMRRVSVEPPATPIVQRRTFLDDPPEPFSTRDLLVEPLDQFLKDFQDKTTLDRAILNHLLHQTFRDTEQNAEPETDLLLQPDPDDLQIRTVLERYPYRDPLKAYQNLTKLAQEEVPFLSHRRCRHFLAGIAPQLLRSIAATPDPDLTLNRFEQVAASLGGKAVLYELFSFSPPTMKLMVEVCSTSPYLCAILINNPGMIDELLDTLLLDQPRSAEELSVELAALMHNAEDPDPILHSFQDKELLRVGVRDLVGQGHLRATMAEISDIATTILNGCFDLAETGLRLKHGGPQLPTGEPCRYAVLGLGKLGGREIGYHSDLDLLVLYEGDGLTDSSACPLTNFQFFTQLAQQGIKRLSAAGPWGKLYHVDMRLRPTGRSGSLVVPIHEFRRYYETGTARLWERQALTRARIVRGQGDDWLARVRQEMTLAIIGKAWQPAHVDEIRQMREKMEPALTTRNVKRSPGGLVDIEFIVQTLQLKYGAIYPQILQPNLAEALSALAATDLLPPLTALVLRDSYLFLRAAELSLRMVTNRASNEIPENPLDRGKIARKLGFAGAEPFLTELTRQMASIRRLFRFMLEQERRTPTHAAPAEAEALSGS